MKVRYIGDRRRKITVKNRRVNLVPGLIIEIPDKYADKVRSLPFFRKMFVEVKAKDDIDKLMREVETLKRKHGDMGMIFWARVKAFDTKAERPVTVERGDVIAKCYATERIKDLYLDAKLDIGDFVIVEVLGGNPTDLIVTGKVFKSWS